MSQKAGGGGARIAATGTSGVKKASVAPGPGVSKPADVCLHCKGPHVVEKCVRFRTVEPRVKRALVRSNNRCWKCLGSGHLARDCPCDPKCDECSGPHHTSLHDIQVPRVSPVVAGVDASVGVVPSAPQADGSA